MIQLIIFGTRGVTWTKNNGQFDCPRCGPQSEFRHKTVRRFFTLYFIPVIPLDLLGEYIECSNCQGTYHTEILEYDSEAVGANAARQVDAIFVVAIKQVMIAMLLADGVIDDEEVKELQMIFEKVSGISVTEQDLREEIAVVQQQDSEALEIVQKLSPHLNDKGKELVISAAFNIAAADGHVDESETRFLKEIADAMELTPAHLNGLLAELAQAPVGANLA
jgi:uncharacterized tellurite resistance protein B-like protein